jgi:hypothetical protein
MPNPLPVSGVDLILARRESGTIIVNGLVHRRFRGSFTCTCREDTRFLFALSFALFPEPVCICKMLFVTATLLWAQCLVGAGQEVAQDPEVAGPSLEPIHYYYDEWPTEIAVSSTGRLFSNYPLV